MKVKKEDLRDMYQNLTTYEVMERLGIRSSSSLYRLLNRAGIERKRPDKGPRVKVAIELVD